MILIISAVILAVTIAGVVSHLLLTPIYQASTQILVNQQNTDEKAIQFTRHPSKSPTHQYI